MQENDNNLSQPTVDEKASPFKFLQEHPDRFLWQLAVAPLAFCLFILAWGFGPIVATCIYIGANLLFSLLDIRLLGQQGRPSPKHWTVLIVPVYIWQRLTLNKQGKSAFITWIIAFSLSLVIDSMSYGVALEDTACELVTNIIFNEYGAGQYGDKAAAMALANPELQTPSCINVSIYESVNSTFHRATATLENGHDLDITIRELDGQIEVALQDIEEDFD